MLESLIGVLVGIVPALALLFFALKDYEGAFEERTLFRLFIWGIFLGLIAVIFEIVPFFSLNPKIMPLSFCLISIPGIAIFQAMLKLMLLNKKKFQVRKETTFYGLALGLGFGAIYSFSWSFAEITPRIQLGDYYSAFLIILFVLANLLMQGSTGAVLGYGSTSGRIFKWLGFAVIIHSGFNLVLFIANLGIARSEIFIALVLSYSIVLFLYVAKIFILRVLPEELRKQRRRYLRFSTR